MSDSSEDLFAFTLDINGIVTAVADVDEEGNLSPDPISPNETYTKVDSYIVQQETGGGDWTIYSFDAGAGYWSVTAEGHGTLDLAHLAGGHRRLCPGRG